ncbi:MAG: hypothetical protein DVB25_03625 [Verrucomicrobia bacterium]|nr:MAG: hypothetical protein DVB25_03625 [Verrucomicrobiota bacterium]
MNRRLAILATLFTLVAAPFGQAGGKAGELGMVTFHLEIDASGASPKIAFSQMDDGKARYFLRSPEITMKDIVAFSPIPSGAGEDYGLVFQLKGPARQRLYALSAANLGRYLLVQANGRVVDGVWIDKPVDDGVLVIWKGITTGDIKLFDKVLPRIGTKEKAQKAKAR